jgi:hypothetical protein
MLINYYYNVLSTALPTWQKDEMSVLPGDLYEFPTVDWWWRCPKFRADFVPSITEQDTIFNDNDKERIFL